ncbi:MAG: hypothetical protein KKF56_02335 [Nanoarchaeota archaeon]|nr:hypothetical protein [Nanoarchaeota archaeon]
MKKEGMISVLILWLALFSIVFQLSYVRENVLLSPSDRFGITYPLGYSQLENGVTRNMGINDRVRFVRQEPGIEITYYVKLIDLSSSKADLQISGQAENKSLNVGDEERYDLDYNTLNDISIKFESFSSNKGRLRFKYVNETFNVDIQRDYYPYNNDTLPIINESIPDPDDDVEVIPEKKVPKVIAIAVIVIVVLFLVAIVLIAVLMEDGKHRRRIFRH